MAFTDLHLQNQLILVEALTYWAYDIYNTDEEFDRFDPRRNRAATPAQELLRTGDIPQGSFSELVDPEWAGPASE